MSMVHTRYNVWKTLDSRLIEHSPEDDIEKLKCAGYRITPAATELLTEARVLRHTPGAEDRHMTLTRLTPSSLNHRGPIRYPELLSRIKKESPLRPFKESWRWVVALRLLYPEQPPEEVMYLAGTMSYTLPGMNRSESYLFVLGHSTKSGRYIHAVGNAGTHMLRPTSALVLLK